MFYNVRYISILRGQLTGGTTGIDYREEGRGEDLKWLISVVTGSINKSNACCLLRPPFQARLLFWVLLSAWLISGWWLAGLIAGVLLELRLSPFDDTLFALSPPPNPFPAPPPIHYCRLLQFRFSKKLKYLFLRRCSLPRFSLPSSPLLQTSTNPLKHQNQTKAMTPRCGMVLRCAKKEWRTTWSHPPKKKNFSGAHSTWSLSRSSWLHPRILRPLRRRIHLCFGRRLEITVVKYCGRRLLSRTVRALNEYACRQHLRLPP